MGETKIEFISAGFAAILQSNEVKAFVEDAGEKMAQKANANIQGNSKGFKTHSWMAGYGGGRWVASVWTTDYASMVAESEHKALSKAVK